jgi:hypothetical protein
VSQRVVMTVPHRDIEWTERCLRLSGAAKGPVVFNATITSGWEQGIAGGGGSGADGVLLRVWPASAGRAVRTTHKTVSSPHSKMYLRGRAVRGLTG